MGERQDADVRYTAFLSYSHKDAAAALRLHRKLETYRLPKRLVGTATARGTVPERLWPIFRDREELPAATDLSETVRQALAESGALIILCSPNAAGSLWVAEEIETFRRLHPDRPILAAILDGDPPDCFPPALRAFGQDGTWHEPLATDLRRQGDGARLGLLKLVAGITGVGLDALVQRDAQRKIRRVTAVTAAALIAMLAMAASTLVTIEARREAERQRTEAERQRAAAEGQIEFMLTDLRARLRSVGRIDVMRAVNAQALRYYDAQRESPGIVSDSALRRARVIRAIGDDELNRGNVTAALTAFQSARRITAEQLALRPNDSQRILQHARSEFWVGRIYELRRDWPRAQRQYSRFAAAAERLIAASPNNHDHMMELAWSAIDQGNLQLNGAEDPAAAQRWYGKAIYWFGRAAQVRSGDERPRQALANAYGWLADSYYMQASAIEAAAAEQDPSRRAALIERARPLWRQSLGARIRQHRMTGQLHRADPANSEYLYRFALAQRAVAAMLTKVRNDPVSCARIGAAACSRIANDARGQLFQAYERASVLARRDSSNVEWQLLRAFGACNIYFGDFGLPPGVSRSQLAEEVRSTASTLASRRDPRTRELARCINALA